ncbi:MAG TPA: hypothetical protein PLA88_02390 [Bacteroidales bacterium]|nr:hypothetical protein [Bacteroidales bacterium]
MEIFYYAVGVYVLCTGNCGICCRTSQKPINSLTRPAFSCDVSFSRSRIATGIAVEGFHDVIMLSSSTTGSFNT